MTWFAKPTPSATGSASLASTLRGRAAFARAAVLLFGYTFSWVFATVGLMVRDPESA
jgi:hypothetical protein